MLRVTTPPTLGIILGSGLGDLVELVEDKVVIPYSDIPNFPQSTVEGHAGNFVFWPCRKCKSRAYAGAISLL